MASVRTTQAAISAHVVIVVYAQIVGLACAERVYVFASVHPSVSEDLAQLALLYNMNSEFDKALPLLHKRLVIHEKYGPGNLSTRVIRTSITLS
jgi:hypothetical protein